MITAIVKLELEPIKTPNFIFIKKSEALPDEFRKVHVSELDYNSICDLCAVFKKDMLQKAGITNDAKPA